MKKLYVIALSLLLMGSAAVVFAAPPDPGSGCPGSGAPHRVDPSASPVRILPQSLEGAEGEDAANQKQLFRRHARSEIQHPRDARGDAKALHRSEGSRCNTSRKAEGAPDYGGEAHGQEGPDEGRVEKGAHPRADREA